MPVGWRFPGIVRGRLLVTGFRRTAFFLPFLAFFAAGFFRGLDDTALPRSLFFRAPCTARILRRFFLRGSLWLGLRAFLPFLGLRTRVAGRACFFFFLFLGETPGDSRGTLFFRFLALTARRAVRHRPFACRFAGSSQYRGPEKDRPHNPGACPPACSRF